MRCYEAVVETRDGWEQRVNEKLVELLGVEMRAVLETMKMKASWSKEVEELD